MIEPPRTTESLLEALGADADFREAVLGDLAEEFSERVDRDGVFAARHWYHGQAMRAAPHFLRNWARGVQLRDLTHLLGIVMASWVTTMMLAGLLNAIVWTVLWASGGSWSVHPSRRDPVFYTIALALALRVGTVGGYVAAWFHRKAPLIGALAVGVVWSCVNVAAGLIAIELIAMDTVPLWYRLAAPLLLIISTITGGVLRVWTSGPAHRDLDAASM
jgi:hypothetical protein